MATEKQKNNIIVNPSTGEMIAPVEVLDEAALAALLTQSMNNPLTLFQQSGIESGVADTPLKAFNQLETKDVVMRVLHINCVHISRAAADEKDKKGVDATDYPVMTFNELPGYYYSGGKRLMQLVTTWAKATGDEFELSDLKEKGFVFSGDRMLPKLNEYISKGNYPSVVMKPKEGKDYDYTDVFVLGV